MPERAERCHGHTEKGLLRGFGFHVCTCVTSERASGAIDIITSKSVSFIRESLRFAMDLSIGTHIPKGAGRVGVGKEGVGTGGLVV